MTTDADARERATELDAVAFSASDLIRTIHTVELAIRAAAFTATVAGDPHAPVITECEPMLTEARRLVESAAEELLTLVALDPIPFELDPDGVTPVLPPDPSRADALIEFIDTKLPFELLDWQRDAIRRFGR
jgi:hypothetical protein